LRTGAGAQETPGSSSIWSIKPITAMSMGCRSRPTEVHAPETAFGDHSTLFADARVHRVVERPPERHRGPVPSRLSG